jgi:serine O-acetyltransferase
MIKEFKMDAARWLIPQQVADISHLTFSKILKLWWNYFPLRAMLLYRFGSWCRQKHIPLAGIIQRAIALFYGLEINISTHYGGGLYIAHPIGSVISAEKIGENCTIISSVTIGMRNEWKFPRIGNNVFIGTGARILGGIEIGDNAVIGANAVVIHDVPAGATAVGIPARIIRINGQRVEDSPAEKMSFEGVIE